MVYRLASCCNSAQAVEGCSNTEDYCLPSLEPAKMINRWKKRPSTDPQAWLSMVQWKIDHNRKKQRQAHEVLTLQTSIVR